MKKNISILLTITDFGHDGAKWCRIYEWLPGAKESTMRTISYDDARRMMWELKLAGAGKTLTPNWFDRHISTIDVWLFLPV